MKAMSLEEFGEITRFVQKHHPFGRIKQKEQIEAAIDAGILPELAKYGLNIKYVRCDYDTRYAEVWRIALGHYRFASNMFASSGKPDNFPYDTLYDLCMGYLKGEFTDVSRFKYI